MSDFLPDYPPTFVGQVCARCVLDQTADGIVFDAEGRCNYCAEFLERSGEIIAPDLQLQEQKLQELIVRIKTAGRNKRYDCVIGVSGGVDSSWVLVKAVELGLRPLAAHMDNGWNSELAQNNIANLVRGLGVDLHTHVIEWTEYRALMESFFAADVVDIELLYDNAMIAVNYHQARKFGTRAILAGTNQATEGMKMPRSWNWLKFDKRNIKAIASQFGCGRMSSFPSIGTLGYLWHEGVQQIRWLSFLDLLPYRKKDALERLSQDFGYKPYPYKHYESVFTRFYQGYILPVKFGVDKRKVHLSTLIMTGEIARSDAIARLSEIPYPSRRALEDDVRYFLKKMRWSESDLVAYLSRPRRSHDEFGSERWAWESLRGVYRRFGGTRTR